MSDKITDLADTGDMAAVTRRVNGGLTGLDDRLKLYAAALTYLEDKLCAQS